MRTVVDKGMFGCDLGFRFGVAKAGSDEVMEHFDTEKAARKEAHRYRCRGTACEAVRLEFKPN